MKRKRSWFYRLLAGVALVSATTSATAAAAPRKIKVPPSLPYYALLRAQQQPEVQYGQLIGSCTMAPRASCRAAQLTGRLTGAVLALSDLIGASRCPNSGSQA